MARGNIKLKQGYKSTSTFKYRAEQTYNSVPVDYKVGNLAAVKRKCKKWVQDKVPLDWG